ncbi:MAG TPA: class I SAM-dependent methyltransferase [Candidatus Binataceae bacterium]|nr:class I SAM-dependent methyltransferase [Candidatus Binataceae bacterium]
MSTSASAIHDNILRAYQTRTLMGEDGALHKLRPGAVSYERGEFLAQMVSRAGAKTTLETGCGSGLSAMFILESIIGNGAGPGAHVIMDPEQDSFFQGMGKRLIKDAGAWEYVEFHQERSQIVMPRLWSESRIFDAVYIDGDHKFDGVFCDAYYAHRLLKPGGIVVIDDVWMDAVYLACHFLEESYRYENIGELRVGYSSVGADSKIDESFTYGKAKNRPSIRAYRKPLTEVADDESYNLPFATISGEVPEDIARRRVSDLSREALVEMSRGNSQEARRLLIRALRFQPTRLKTYLRLSRTFLPSSIARALGGRTHHTGDPHA